MVKKNKHLIKSDFNNNKIMIFDKKGEMKNSQSKSKRNYIPFSNTKNEIKEKTIKTQKNIIENKKIKTMRLGSFMGDTNIFNLVDQKIEVKNKKRKNFIEKVQLQFFKNKKNTIEVISSSSSDSDSSVNSDEYDINKDVSDLFTKSKKKDKSGEEKKGENLNDMKTDETIEKNKNFEKSKNPKKVEKKQNNLFRATIMEKKKKNPYKNLSEVNIINLIEKNGGILIESSDEEIYTPELPQSYFPKNPKLKNFLDLIKTKTETIENKEKMQIQTNEDLLEKQKLNIVQDFLEEEKDFEHIDLVKDYLDDLHIRISNGTPLADDNKKDNVILNDDKEDMKKIENEKYVENGNKLENFNKESMKHSFFNIKPYKKKSVNLEDIRNKCDEKHQDNNINLKCSFLDFKQQQVEEIIISKNDEKVINHDFFDIVSKKVTEKKISLPQKIQKPKNKKSSKKINKYKKIKKEYKKKATPQKIQFLKQIISPEEQQKKDLKKEIWEIYKEKYSIKMMGIMNKALNNEGYDVSKTLSDLMKNIVSEDFIKYITDFDDKEIDKIIFIQRFWRQKTNSMIIRKISKGNKFFLRESFKHKNRFSNFGLFLPK